jgi:hypothetical protein
VNYFTVDDAVARSHIRLRRIVTRPTTCCEEQGARGLGHNIPRKLKRPGRHRDRRGREAPVLAARIGRGRNASFGRMPRTLDGFGDRRREGDGGWPAVCLGSLAHTPGASRITRALML